jgi:uncharacterized glyoxalase superfamily protein PhnB
MPDCSVTPVLGYPDVSAAVSWLCGRFGFVLRWQVDEHRAQLAFGDGAVVVASAPEGSGTRAESVMIRVDDVDAHYERVTGLGVDVGGPPQSHAYGERQYTAVDLAGRHWTFSETVGDVDPRDWGAVPGESIG